MIRKCWSAFSVPSGVDDGFRISSDPTDNQVDQALQDAERVKNAARFTQLCNQDATRKRPPAMFRQAGSLNETPTPSQRERHLKTLQQGIGKGSRLVTRFARVRVESVSPASEELQRTHLSLVALDDQIYAVIASTEISVSLTTSRPLVTARIPRYIS